MELRATYRLQLGDELDFAKVSELVPYLRDLGISHLYLSPSLQAASGSTHGYDVVDPTRVSAVLGGEQGLRDLASAGLGIILDIVPNHMGRSEENRWWTDPELRQQFFDIDPETGFCRRFFDVDDLVALRQEDPEVFEVTHAKVLELVREGVLDGLRVDHPDGLADPAGYLSALRDRGVERVWVEKILSSAPPGERLRDWPVSGTVGYEFLNDVAALFINPAGEAALSALWLRISGDERPFSEVALEAKLEQATQTFSREVGWLERLAPRFSSATLARALAALPIYRTYVDPHVEHIETADIAAVSVAGIDQDLASVLRLEEREGIPDEFVTRFQQTSPAISAKGVEDTAFYRYLRMLALNEVGGDPERFSLSVNEFHAANLKRAQRFPAALLITQTHDTKRSGDARARIGAIADMAEEWQERVMRWHDLTAALRPPERDGESRGPDFVDEYLIYQTLVGGWPVETARLETYLEKALREAKRRTNWVAPDEVYEASVQAFARGLLTHPPFVADFTEFLERLRPAGERSALGQLLLKLCSPGVPDIFQGDELWRLSFVDPDNRRPVDWEARRVALARLRAGATPDEDQPKLHVIRQALALRARRASAFAGEYFPLRAGPHVCAFLRGEAEILVVVAIRGAAIHEASLDLPPQASGDWHSVLTEMPGATLDGPAPLSRLGSHFHHLWLFERR
jgi:(1->4)-alpha-D-glucan 1-alpha-D-glucosylmutase